MANSINGTRVLAREFRTACSASDTMPAIDAVYHKDDMTDCREAGLPTSATGAYPAWNL